MAEVHFTPDEIKLAYRVVRAFRDNTSITAHEWPALKEVAKFLAIRIADDVVR